MTMGSCLRMDSETVSAAGALTWERGSAEMSPRGQKFQDDDAAAVIVAVGGVGGRLTA